MTRSNEYAICPYCGYRHGDCWEWVTEQDKEFTCNGCEREFIVYADIIVTYVTKRVYENPEKPTQSEQIR